MALISVDFFSESLRMQTHAVIIMPEKMNTSEIGVTRKSGEGKPKCLYLLHGLSDDETIWLRRTSIERYASEYGICVVMPCGARSFYSDMKYGLNYYTYIAKELPGFIEGVFNVSSANEDRYIGGLSMGGYGALKIAMTEAGRYNAAFALSPVSDIHNSKFTEVLVPVFGGDIPDTADLYKLSFMHNEDAVKPRLYITIGTDDYMYEDSVILDKHLKNLNYDYTYEATGGSHSWELWDVTVQNALKWMLD